MLTAFRPHPFPIMRAKHLDTWLADESDELTGLDPNTADASDAAMDEGVEDASLKP